MCAGTAVVDHARLGLLVVPASFLSAAFAAGALVDRAVGGLLRGPERSPLLGVAVHIGVGLACLALLATASAMCGVFWVAGLVTLPLLAYGAVRVFRACCDHPMTVWSLPAVSGGLALGCAWLLAWLWATVPPIFYDELVYHLVFPQHALLTGKLQATPWVYFNMMPHAADLLLAWGMAIGGDLGARATVVALWAACTLGVWALAETISRPGTGRWAGVLTAAVLAASPALWFLATLPFAETCLAAAVVVAGVVLAAPHADRRPWVALGLVLALAAAVKLSGVIWVTAGLAAAFVAGWPLRDLGRAAVIAFAGVAPWWVRAFVYTGNPIYPMGYAVLGGRPWSEASQALLQADLPAGAADLGWTGLLRLPVDLVLHPERFGSASDVGMLAVAAVCLVAALPVITRVKACGDRARWLGDAAAVFVLVAGLGWVATSTTARFFAPAIVVSLAILAGAVLQLGRGGQAVMVALMLAAGVWGTGRFINQHSEVFSSYDAALGKENTEDYLTRRLDHVAAARFVRENLPADARLLFIGETRPYYFARETVAPYPYDTHPLHRWVQESGSPEALAARLADEGFSHVILNVREFRRLRGKYGVLAFSGTGAEAHDRRLKALPRALRQVFVGNGVYVFEVPKRSRGG